jgi:hypothetical protein
MKSNLRLILLWTSVSIGAIIPINCKAFEAYKFDSLNHQPEIIKVYISDCMIRGGVPVIIGDINDYFSPLVRPYPQIHALFPEFTSEWDHSLDFKKSRFVQLTSQIPWF